MNKWFCYPAITASAVLFLAVVAQGTTYTPVHLSKCVAEAGIIVAGTVESISSRKVDGMIVSDIRFKSTTFLKDTRSTRGGPLALHILGGTVGGEHLEDVGGPRFFLNERYVLLLKRDLGSRENGYTPVVFFNQGQFPVFVDPGEAAASVHDWLRRPIVGVQDGRIVSVQSVAEPATSSDPRLELRTPSLETIKAAASRVDPAVPVIEIGPSHDPAVRLSEDAFLAELRKLMLKE